MKTTPKKPKTVPSKSAAEKPAPKSPKIASQSANDSLRSLLRGSYVHKMCG
jgi:hypothetical protein